MRPLIPLVVAAAVLAAETTTYGEFYALGASVHLHSEDRALNAANWGVGAGIANIDEDGLGFVAMGVTYRDSYREQATGFGAGIRYVVGDPLRWHATATGLVGVLHGSNAHGPVGFITTGVGYHWLNLELVPTNQFIGAWLRCSWQIP